LRLGRIRLRLCRVRLLRLRILLLRLLLRVLALRRILTLRRVLTLRWILLLRVTRLGRVWLGGRLRLALLGTTEREAQDEHELGSSIDEVKSHRRFYSRVSFKPEAVANAGPHRATQATIRLLER
jgi:hypothetical protein